MTISSLPARAVHAGRLHRHHPPHFAGVPEAPRLLHRRARRAVLPGGCAGWNVPLRRGRAQQAAAGPRRPRRPADDRLHPPHVHQAGRPPVPRDRAAARGPPDVARRTRCGRSSRRLLARPSEGRARSRPAPVQALAVRRVGPGLPSLPDQRRVCRQRARDWHVRVRESRWDRQAHRSDQSPRFEGQEVRPAGRAARHRSPGQHASSWCAGL